MTLQQMEYIVAVDQYRHFVKAAESCRVTQSTLSSMIQKAETELDVIIFDRNAHPVRPTEIGEEIIRQAKVVLYNASQLQELVAARKQQEVGDIKLGIAFTISPYILPKMFALLSSQHPGIKLNVEEARVPAIVQRLERGELDVALLATPVESDELLEIPVYYEKFVVYVSPQDELHAWRELSMDQLPAQRIWVVREGYCPNRGLFPFCHCQTEKSVNYEAGSIETLVRVVDENGGFAIIPQLHVPLLHAGQQTNIRMLQHPEPQREIALVVRRDFVRQRMLNILVEVLKEIIPSPMLDERIKKFSVKL